MRLEQKIAKILISKKMTLAVAESCTGGLLSHSLTNIPGSSTFFLLGIIAYDNAAKIKILKVPQNIIRNHGAVSPEVVTRMAQGVRKILKTDFGIGITGIAGPTGGNKQKPVGLTYISISHQQGTIISKSVFKGNRSNNKMRAKNTALRMLLKLIA